MKRNFLFGIAAAALLATSCQEKFDGGVQVGDSATVTFNVGLPQIGTRAFSDGKTATELQYAVYLKHADESLELLPAFTTTDDKMENLKQKVSFNLVTGNTYAFVFWAAAPDAPYTVEFAADGATMTVDYANALCNAENRDAFYAYDELLVNGPLDKEEELYRPFAQINVGTSDYEQAQAAGYKPQFSYMAVTGAYKKLDLVTGDVSEPVEDPVNFVTFDYAKIPDWSKEAFPYEPDTYKYMAMTYVLVDENKALTEVSFACKVDKKAVGDERAVHTVGSVPVQRNYRTNIFGALLTSEVDINVIIIPAYEKPDYIVDLGDGVSFDEAENTFTITNANGLAWIAEQVNNPGGADKTVETGNYTYGAANVAFKDQTVKLGTDIDMAGVDWTPIGYETKESGASINAFAGTFDGCNHTISNLTVKTEENSNAGLFGATNRATIKDVTLENVNIQGHYKTGAIVGDGYNARIENCHVKGGKVTSTPRETEPGVYDDANNVGGIVGYLNGQPEAAYVKDCTVDGLEITAFRKVGGIAGVATTADDANPHTSSVEISGCTVTNTNIIANRLDTRYAEMEKAPDADKIVGNKTTDRTTVENNTAGDDVTVTIWEVNAENQIDIDSVAGLAAIADIVRSGNTYKNKTIKLTEDLNLEGQEWTPIGSTSIAFEGTFDGGDKTISNITVSQGNYVGLFGNTLNAKIKNIKVENATIKGRLGVAVIAGHPYTTDIENIEITGKVIVEGAFYVGTCGGGNMCYGNYRNITVNVEEGSYVKANSVENGTTYATYAGGVIGHPGEGAYTYENITSNIDVIGSSCYVGGIIGLAHYGSTFKNCKSSGNVSLTGAIDKADGATVGGIAGCWNAGGANVSFDKDCEFTGTLESNQMTEEELLNHKIVGNVWGDGGTGKLFIADEDVTDQHSEKY